MDAPSLVDYLPDAILCMVMDLVAGTDRCRFAHTCRNMTRVHAEYRWRSMRCSMYRLLRRGRYSEVPHWTADLAALFRLLRRPTFEELHHLVIVIDAPCFDTERSPWVHPECDRALATGLHRPPVQSLAVHVQRRNYGYVAPSAVRRLLTFLPALQTVRLTEIRNVGSEALRLLLDRPRTLRAVHLEGCGFTETARSRLVRRFTAGAAEDLDEMRRWSTHLTTFELSGAAAASITRTVERQLVDRPLCLPATLRYLDMRDALEPLTGLQLLLTVAVLPALEELIVCVNSHNAIRILDTHRDRVFPHLCVRIQL